MRGLPYISLIGYVAKDAIYHKVNESGGYLNLTVGCTRMNHRDGDPNPACYYMVRLWIKDDSKLPALLSKGVPIYVHGTWEVNKSGDDIYNQIVATDIQLLPSGKK